MRLGDIDLSARWRALVSAGLISASVKQPSGIAVDYGLRIGETGAVEEWVGDGAPAAVRTAIDAGAGRSTVFYGAYAAQLQLVRTLRPPPAANLQDLPPYDASTDSFVVGPLRLQIREKLARVECGSGRAWDVYHNVSPCDPRLHALLFPDLSDEARNWRRQALNVADCVDLCWLARAAPDLLLGFNSLRAGASQNHVHIHAWPADFSSAGRPYAVCEAGVLADVPALVLRDEVVVALLEYPVACIRVTGRDAAAAGKALGAALGAVEALGLAHNVVAIDDEAYLFARRADGERAAELPTLKLGCSEMAGCFHVQSRHELERVAAPGAAERALADVSASPLQVWEFVGAALRGQ